MIASYLRVSSEFQKKAHSVSSQRAALAAMFTARGWDYAAVVEYVDEAKSGASTVGRDGYLRLVADIRAGQVRRVCCYDMDRLSRDPDERSSVVRLCMEKDCAITECAGDVNPYTAAGMLLERIKAALAEYQRTQTRARTKAGFAALKQSGAPFGKLKIGGRFGGARLVDPARNGCSKCSDDQIREAAAAIGAGSTLALEAARLGIQPRRLKHHLARLGLTI